MDWLTEGDRNTNSLNRKSSQRAKKNHISKLEGANGSLETSRRNFEHIAVSYFRNIYASKAVQIQFEEGFSCLALPSFAYTSTAQSLLYYTAFDQYKMEKEKSGLEK